MKFRCGLFVGNKLIKYTLSETRTLINDFKIVEGDVWILAKKVFVEPHSARVPKKFVENSQKRADSDNSLMY